jgi:O-antigen ligase
VLLILLSLSRIAFFSALVIMCLTWFSPRSAGSWLRFLGVLLATIAIGYLAIQDIGPLHSRFYTGDVQSIGGGLAVNLEGRSQIWATTWDSYLTSPWFGHGVGSADNLITRVYGGSVGHPHNDYLRILHDYGLVGLVMWVIGFVWLLRRTWRAWHRGPRGGAHDEPDRVSARERRVHAASCLALVGLALSMITDNPLDYLFVLAPIGVLVGFSLGLDARTEAARRTAAGVELQPSGSAS